MSPNNDQDFKLSNPQSENDSYLIYPLYTYIHTYENVKCTLPHKCLIKN